MDFMPPDDLAEEILSDNRKLVSEFNAKPIGTVRELPRFYTFENNLIHSHRDFDIFFKRLRSGERSAIVSGLNASGQLHLGHKVVFDTNLLFQKEYGVHVFIPISDDESYVSKKVATQEDALKNAMALAREMLAYGFDPKKTHIIIDQVYTNIYNLAIKLSRHITMSEIKAIYGYKNEENVGLHFYPTIQSAHVLLPQHLFGIRNVLVPIGPDEDAHLRAARDIASRTGMEKPAVLHTIFLPGVDNAKMSKSKNNAIFYNDDEKTITKKRMNAFSGGRSTIEEHRRLGGNPDVDVSYIYLRSYFLNRRESEALAKEYRDGKLLSGELKKMLAEKVIDEVRRVKENLAKVTNGELEEALLKNESRQKID